MHNVFIHVHGLIREFSLFAIISEMCPY